MLQRGNARTRLRHIARFNIGNDDCRVNSVYLGQDIAPGRYNQAVAIGLAAILMHAALGATTSLAAKPTDQTRGGLAVAGGAPPTGAKT